MASKRQFGKSSPFSGVRGFVSEIQNLVFEKFTDKKWAQKTTSALNGEAMEVVRSKATLKNRRKFGAFFTGTKLGKRLANLSIKNAGDGVCHDPACGMGDLLLARARNFPLGKTLEQTLKEWGEKISGTDLHAEFVEGARLRLLLLARTRHGANNANSISAKEYFPYLQVCDGLVKLSFFRRANTIMMNPPFGFVKAPKDCSWGRGRVSQAALFLAKALEAATPGTEILAILPEVLRSGAFSEQWRAYVSDLAKVSKIRPCGIFDKHADVDVFFLRLIKRHPLDNSRVQRWPSQIGSFKVISDYFNIRVGRVVPHRDPISGPRRSYIHAKCVPVWKTMISFTETRKHAGAAFDPPFVVVRRTSRPSHSYRATATIISGDGPVFVENHLIVCEPKAGGLAACRRLMRHLKSEKVNKYLNRRIRCRHLTVGAIGTIPYQDKI